MNLETSSAKVSGPKVHLLGKTPGYRGMRITGIPFTDRKILLGNESSCFGLFAPGEGYAVPTDLPSVMYKPTAAVTWRTLTNLHFLPLLRSVYPFHPHLPGKPSATENAASRLHWQTLAELSSIRSVIEVGNVKFKQGLKELPASGIND